MAALNSYTEQPFIGILCHDKSYVMTIMEQWTIDWHICIYKVSTTYIVRNF